MVEQLLGFHGAERWGGDLVGWEKKICRFGGRGVRLLGWEEEEKEEEEDEEERAVSAQVVSWKRKAKGETQLVDNKWGKKLIVGQTNRYRLEGGFCIKVQNIGVQEGQMNAALCSLSQRTRSFNSPQPIRRPERCRRFRLLSSRAKGKACLWNVPHQPG